MADQASDRQDEGLPVVALGLDPDLNEIRVPVDRAHELSDRTRDLGIGDTGTIVRVKHGPFVAAESELRSVNAGSLARALTGSYLGTTLCVDRTPPPVATDFVEIDDRYHLDVKDGRLVAVVTERHDGRPAQSETEIAGVLTRVAAAYSCTVLSVTFRLPGGGDPAELLIDFTGSELEPSHVAQLHEEQEGIVRGMPHDVEIAMTVEDSSTVGMLMDGGAALADYLSAVRGGGLTAATVMDLLRGGHHKLLLGLAESSFLEVKSAPYPLSAGGDAATRAKIELAQDVARFANAEVDAVLVVGFHEAKVNGASVIDRLAPANLGMIDVAQHTQILDERIIPPIDGLRIEQFPITSTAGLLAIFVPAQPVEMQPFLVHGALAGDKVEGAFFSIVRSRGEGSITTSAQQIHAYIVAGKRYLRGDDQ